MPTPIDRKLLTQMKNRQFMHPGEDIILENVSMDVDPQSRTVFLYLPSEGATSRTEDHGFRVKINPAVATLFKQHTATDPEKAVDIPGLALLVRPNKSIEVALSPDNLNPVNYNKDPKPGSGPDEDDPQPEPKPKYPGGNTSKPEDEDERDY